MQPLSRTGTAPRSRARAAFLACAAGALVAAGGAGTAAAECPWVVQPHITEVSFAATKSEKPPAYEILFDGRAETASAFYAFSVTSADLAWQLAGRSAALPELGDGARTLEPKPTPIGTTVYQLAPETIEPETIYLVAAATPIERLERLGARIDPDRPLNVATRFRGGSDQSGPLPRRTVQGFQIVSAGPEQAARMEICAYQVAMR